MTEVRAQLEQSLGSAYTIERELGGGGMSRVFVAREAALDRPVVVKVLAPDLAAGVSTERFTRETRLAASLQQANIVPVLGAGITDDGLPWYTMPFVEGESLRARLKQDAALPVGDVIAILRDVAKALAYAHERGVVHRDIKPDNVLLSGGTAVVVDFGIAKALSASRSESPRATLTQMGTSIGTPAYMSPEQAAGDPDVDGRSDLYSLGAMAFELLTGRPPFAGRTPQQALAAHLAEEPQHVAELRADIPPTLAQLVMRCLAKDASQRPQTAAEVIRTLDAVVSTSAVAGMPAMLLGGAAMFRRALAIYAAAFVIVAIVSRAAIVAIGLPDWVFPGALIVMALGLPVLLFVGYAQYGARRAPSSVPAYTPGGTLRPASGTMTHLAAKASSHLSWRRAAWSGVYAMGAFTAIVAAYMTLRALGIGPAGSLFAAGKLTESDRIVPADVAVSGPDTALGSVVGEALRTGLGESRVMQLLPAASVTTTLERMGKPAGATVDLALGRDIAVRTGAKAVLQANVTPLAGAYVLALRLVSADSGAELAAFRRTASGPTDLLATIDKLVRDVRGKIGESLRSVHASPELEQVTTGSIDALRKFTAANALGDDDVRAIALLKDAVALDTGFAMAWRRLGALYGNVGVPHRPSARRDARCRVAQRWVQPARQLRRGAWQAARATARLHAEGAGRLGPRRRGGSPGGQRVRVIAGCMVPR